jgi:4-amino-4-deoxy-L-arabinose transferase-like glycosyltransferase
MLLASWLVTFWLIWRVWRRGQISRWILIIFGSGLGCINAAFHVSKHPVALIVLVIYAVQVTLLLSPALSQDDGPQADDPRRVLDRQ